MQLHLEQVGRPCPFHPLQHVYSPSIDILDVLHARPSLVEVDCDCCNNCTWLNGFVPLGCCHVAQSKSHGCMNSLNLAFSIMFLPAGMIGQFHVAEERIQGSVMTRCETGGECYHSAHTMAHRPISMGLYQVFTMTHVCTGSVAGHMHVYHVFALSG